MNERGGFLSQVRELGGAELELRLKAGGWAGLGAPGWKEGWAL